MSEHESTSIIYRDSERMYIIICMSVCVCERELLQLVVAVVGAMCLGPLSRH